MSDELKSIQDYIHAIEKKLENGDATEHTHRAALGVLIESLASGISATNEPKHIDCGAPDFVVRKGVITIGYIEAKDIGVNLDATEKSDQLKRYLKSLTNLILTDYLEFRWYVDGEKRLSARLGTATKDGKIKKDKEGLQATAELLTSFFEHKAENVGTPQELARRMARLAHMIRDLIIEAFKQEEDTGSLHNQLAAFRDNLIPDLSPEYFADMYAQTITYGLFAARCTAPDSKDFTRQNAAYLLPKTNPFLRKLFNTIAGPELDERIAWLVDDLAQILAQADMGAVLKNFGKHSGKEDPVVHFYETFLTAYDPKVREMRGVYYTPEPVVSYIVRSIDHLLKARFEKPQGLADENTLILDPATGTATFLYMVINEIHQAFAGQEGMWNDYVAEKLLKRLFGFELLMAPYAVAHLKLGLLLQETGYKFQSDERLGVYLTNTLDEAIKHSETLFAQWISDEANAAAEVKKEKPIMVVLGNPPYSVSSLNRGEWIDNLLDDYKKDLQEKKLNLDDDYIKFIRFAQWRIDQTGHGILGFITNNSYLDGLTHRRMREYLLDSFSSIYILNLHGSSRRGENAPGDIKDENVFDIQQGVAIGIFIKEQHKNNNKKVYYADVWGMRDSKYKELFESDVTSTNWQELKPIAPYFFFVPKDFSLQEEYERGWLLTDVFKGVSGIETKRDAFAIDFNRNTLVERIGDFVDCDCAIEEIKDRYSLRDNEWNVAEAREALRADRSWEGSFVPCLYRPFDIRNIIYSDVILARTRGILMDSMNKPNLGLIAARQTKEDFAILAAPCVCTHKIVTVYDRSFMFPLYLYPAKNEMQFDGGKRRPNLNPEFINDVSDKLGLTFIEDGQGDLEQTFGPEDVFNYAYAVFHSPIYRTRYAEFLKIDFPRLPLTSDKALFKALAEKGAELASLHLMESSILNKSITKYPITGSNEVEKLSYDDNNQRIYINKAQYFEGVPTEIWNFHIGGYQVCEKWLKDRKGRSLTYDERVHYQKIIVALKETIRLMKEIDELIPGWPLE
jgi:predicted helicase